MEYVYDPCDTIVSVIHHCTWSRGIDCMHHSILQEASRHIVRTQMDKVAEVVLLTC